MLRVALITDHSDQDGKVDGGVQAVTSYLVAALVQQPDLELHVISFRFGNTSQRTIQERNYQRHILPGARLGTLTAFWRDQQTLDDLLNRIRPSLVHAQGAGHDGILAARSGHPFVITIHEIMAEEAKYHAGMVSKIRHRLLSRLSERYCIKGGEHTILITPYVADYFDGRLSGEKYLIPNPIADRFFDIVRKESPNRILFAGRLVPRKGVMDLVQAAAIVSRSTAFELVLAGSMDDRPYVQQLRAEVRRSGLERMVQFRGLLSDAEMQDELARCSVLVLPSYQETAPMVIVEAMAAGIPVIASDVGGVRYQVVDGTTGFIVPPGNIQRLAERISDIVNDTGLRQALGQAAKKHAVDEYRADRVAARTVEVYRSIVS